MNKWKCDKCNGFKVAFPYAIQGMKKLTNTQTKILDAIFDWWDFGYDKDGNFVIYPCLEDVDCEVFRDEDEPIRDELEDDYKRQNTKG